MVGQQSTSSAKTGRPCKAQRGLSALPWPRRFGVEARHYPASVRIGLVFTAYDSAVGIPCKEGARRAGALQRTAGRTKLRNTIEFMPGHPGTRK